MSETTSLPRVDELDQVADMDTAYRWPDRMTGSARSRLRHFAAAEVADKHRAFYVTFTRGDAGKPVEGEPATPPAEGDGQPPAGPDAGTGQGEGPQPVRASRGAPYGAGGDPALARFVEPAHPLEIAPAVLHAMQDAIDAHQPARFVAADPDAQFAVLTTGTSGAPRAWGRNVLGAPRLLSRVAGVPQQQIGAVFAQFPQLTLPTAQPLAGEGVSLVEYASSAAGSVTLGRFGRWTDMSRESLIGADSAAISGMHRVGIALDLDNVLVGLVDTAAGAAVPFAADVPAGIRTDMATVIANTASEDPADLVILANPADVHLLEDVTPTGGATIAERFQRFSGALVYPSTAVTAGFMITANLRAGARYFVARAMEMLSDVDIKTGVETVATFVIAGYGVTLTSGFAVKRDVVTP